MSLARIKVMCMTICAFCKVQNVTYGKFAVAFDSQAEVSSSFRRIQRLIAEYVMDSTLIAHLILTLIPVKDPSWKKEFLAKAEKVFEKGKDEADQIKKLEQEKAELIQQIGQLTVDNNWLKKASMTPLPIRKSMINKEG